MDFVGLFWAYVFVFVLAAIPFVEATVVVPIAIFAGLPTISVIVTGIIGNLLTILLVILFVDKIKQWRNRKGKGGDDKEQSGKRSARARNLWRKYGLPGLALLGTILVGSHLTAFLSLIFGGTKKSVTVWMSISVVGWNVVIGLLAHLGFDALNIEHPFIEQFFSE